jgi:hypothetical protein
MIRSVCAKLNEIYEQEKNISGKNRTSLEVALSTEKRYFTKPFLTFHHLYKIRGKQ